MSEYIERKMVIAKNHGSVVYIEDIKNIPSADVAPVVHGRWISRNKGLNNWVDCSECGTVGSPHWKCCPVCEAKMDLEGKHETFDRTVF